MTTKLAKDLPTSVTEKSLFDQGCQVIAGIDEVGRGAWAGPVAVGVAVVTQQCLSGLPAGIRDSKQLTERARERLFDPIATAVAGYAVGFATPLECDELGMTKTQALAARRAFDALPLYPDGVIIDGSHNYTDRSDALSLVGGDRRSVLIAAASVLAKVTRDRLMIAHASRYPAFGFERNKGYGSLEHRNAVARFGMTELHRASWSFANPVGGQLASVRSAPATDNPRL